MMFYITKRCSVFYIKVDWRVPIFILGDTKNTLFIISYLTKRATIYDILAEPR